MDELIALACVVDNLPDCFGHRIYGVRVEINGSFSGYFGETAGVAEGHGAVAGISFKDGIPNPS